MYYRLMRSLKAVWDELNVLVYIDITKPYAREWKTETRPYEFIPNLKLKLKDKTRASLQIEDDTTVFTTSITI